MFCTDEEHFNFLISERYRETLSFTVTQVIEGSSREVHFLWNKIMSGSCVLFAICDIF